MGRFVAATTRTSTARGTVLRIEVPPLRDRGDDIVLLVDHFWQRAQSLTGSRAAPARSTLEALARYHWPGNVRQLENTVAALVVRGPRSGVVGPALLPAAITGGASGPDGAPTLHEARQVFERRFVSGALAQAGGHRTKAASALGVTRQGLAKLLKRLDLDDPSRAVVRCSDDKRYGEPPEA